MTLLLGLIGLLQLYAAFAFQLPNNRQCQALLNHASATPRHYNAGSKAVERIRNNIRTSAVRSKSIAALESSLGNILRNDITQKGRGAKSSVQAIASLESIIQSLEIEGLKQLSGKGDSKSDPSTSKLIDGCWRLIYTSSPGTNSPIQRTFTALNSVSIFQVVNLVNTAPRAVKGLKDARMVDGGRVGGSYLPGNKPDISNVVCFGGDRANVRLRVTALASTVSRPLVEPRKGDGRIFGQNMFGVSSSAPPRDPRERVDFAFQEAAFEFRDLPITIPYPVPFKLLGDEAKGWIDNTYLSEKYRVARGNKGTLFLLERVKDEDLDNDPAAKFAIYPPSDLKSLRTQSTSTSSTSSSLSNSRSSSSIKAKTTPAVVLKTVHKKGSSTLTVAPPTTATSSATAATTAAGASKTNAPAASSMSTSKPSPASSPPPFSFSFSSWNNPFAFVSNNKISSNNKNSKSKGRKGRAVRRVAIIFPAQLGTEADYEELSADIFAATQRGQQPLQQQQQVAPRAPRQQRKGQEALEESAVKCYTAKLERLDWPIGLIPSFFSADYFKGTLKPSKTLEFYYKKVDEAVQQALREAAEEEGNEEKDEEMELVLVGHSIGGWISRAWLSEWCSEDVKKRVRRVVTLGTPHQPPPAGSFLEKADQTRGLLTYINQNFPGAFEEGVEYFSVIGSGVRGQIQRPQSKQTEDIRNEVEEAGEVGKREGGAGEAVEGLVAYFSYAFLAGSGELAGDGIIPVEAAALAGATEIVLQDEEVRHSNYLPASLGRSIRLPFKWYGSPDVVPLWAPAVFSLLD